MEFSENIGNIMRNSPAKERLIYDSSALFQIVDENHVLFRTLTGSFKLSGTGIAIALRKIISSFQSAISPEQVIEQLGCMYEKHALIRLVNFLKTKHILISEAAFLDLTSFDQDFLEKYRYYSSSGKLLKEIVSDLHNMTIGLICTYQFADCFLHNTANSSLIGRFNCIITDRANYSIDNLTSKSEVVFFNNDSELQISDLIKKSDFIIISSSFENYALFKFVNDQCLIEQKKWIRVVLKSEHSEIGPLFVPGETCCYSCLNRRAINNMNEKAFSLYTLLQERSKIFDEFETGTYSSYYMNLLTADIVYYEIMRFFTGLECNLLGTVLTFFEDGYRMEKARIFKYNQCVSCNEQG